MKGRPMPNRRIKLSSLEAVVLALLLNLFWLVPTFAGTEWFDLGTLGGGLSNARAVSADGRAVVGDSDNGTVTHAFRWTEADGMVDLGTMGRPPAYAFHVSADGSVVAGQGSDYSGYLRAFRWTEADGMVTCSPWAEWLLG
jgi:probable HAF family extracellular repeat protein